VKIEGIEFLKWSLGLLTMSDTTIEREKAGSSGPAFFMHISNGNC